MVTITANYKTGELSVKGEHTGRMELASAVFSAIKTMAETEKISYDTAKIKMMETLLKVEKGMEIQDKIARKYGNDLIEHLAELLKEVAEDD